MLVETSIICDNLGELSHRMAINVFVYPSISLVSLNFRRHAIAVNCIRGVQYAGNIAVATVAFYYRPRLRNRGWSLPTLYRPGTSSFHIVSRLASEQASERAFFAVRLLLPCADAMEDAMEDASETSSSRPRRGTMRFAIAIDSKCKPLDEFSMCESTITSADTFFILDVSLLRRHAYVTHL